MGQLESSDYRATVDTVIAVLTNARDAPAHSPARCVCSFEFKGITQVSRQEDRRYWRCRSEDPHGRRDSTVRVPYFKPRPKYRRADVPRLMEICGFRLLKTRSDGSFLVYDAKTHETLDAGIALLKQGAAISRLPLRSVVTSRRAHLDTTPSLPNH